MPKKRDEPREATEIVQFKLRIPETLRSKVEEAAGKNGVSMNAEIADRLKESLDYDGLFSPHLRPALGALAFEIWRIENKTGKKWTEDRATALASAEMAKDIFRYGTPLANGEAIEASIKLCKEVEASIKRKIGYLFDTGAIESSEPTQNAFGGLLGRYIETPQQNFGDEWIDTVWLLKHFNHQPKVDLRSCAEDWNLERSGTALSDAEKVGVKAVFAGLGDMKAEYQSALDAVMEASKEEDLAEAAAQNLIAQARGQGL